MTDVVVECVAGFVTGGLALSAAWGFLWLAIRLVGLSRRTCGRRIAFMGTVGGCVPLALAITLVWWMGGLERMTSVFVMGLGDANGAGWLWLRRMPDGQRAGMHWLRVGISENLLGVHQGAVAVTMDMTRRRADETAPHHGIARPASLPLSTQFAPHYGNLYWPFLDLVIWVYHALPRSIPKPGSRIRDLFFGRIDSLGHVVPIATGDHDCLSRRALGA